MFDEDMNEDEGVAVRNFALYHSSVSAELVKFGAQLDKEARALSIEQNDTIEQQTSVDDVPPGPGRSDVHLAAEDRMSELDEMRSEVSASTAAYCHSSLDSVRRALAKTRR